MILLASNKWGAKTVPIIGSERAKARTILPFAPFKKKEEDMATDKKEYDKQYYLKHRERKLKQRKQYDLEHKKEIKKYKKQYNLENRERISEQKKQYRLENREKVSEQQKIRHKQWRKRNKEKLAIQSKQYRLEHEEQIKQYRLEHKKQREQYHLKNREKILESRNKYQKNQRKTNLKFNLRDKIRIVIWQSLKGGKAGRKWQDLVGYTAGDLIKRLKSTMPLHYYWSDFLNGKLHIDHIIPIRAFVFDKPEDQEFKDCWNLYNLRLLTVEENLKKGSNFDNPILLGLLLEEIKRGKLNVIYH